MRVLCVGGVLDDVIYECSHRAPYVVAIKPDPDRRLEPLELVSVPRLRPYELVRYDFHLWVTPEGVEYQIACIEGTPDSDIQRAIIRDRYKAQPLVNFLAEKSVCELREELKSVERYRPRNATTPSTEAGGVVAVPDPQHHARVG